MTKPSRLTQVERYELHDVIGSGGMATVHIGKRRGDVGFSRIVAIKRIHPHLAADLGFVEMFIDEARLASRIHHPNVVPVVDAVAHDDELLMVMEYVAGLSLAKVLKILRAEEQTMPLPITLRIMADAIEGAHAAHQAADVSGEPLELVHRDISPNNLIIGSDGVTRVLDFGIAKAIGRVHQTRTGVVKGNVGYIAPEQAVGDTVDCRTDIYALALTFWEILVGRPAFDGDTDAERIHRAMTETLPSPSQVESEVPAGLGKLVMVALERDREKRYGSALEMLEALDALSLPIASKREVAAWFQDIGAEQLEQRARQVARVELAEPVPEPSSPASNSPASKPPPTDTAPAIEADTLASMAELAPAPSRRLLLTAGVLLSLGLGAGAGWYFITNQTHQDLTSETSVSAERVDGGWETQARSPVALPSKSAVLTANAAPSTSASGTSVAAAPPTTASSAAPPRWVAPPPASKPNASRPAPDSLLGQD